MKNKYVAYIKKNSLAIPPSAISSELENQIKNIIEVKPFKIIRNADVITIEGLEFKQNECPIIFVGKNHDHGLAYDIFKEYLKQRKPEKVILDLRDYHSDAFEERFGKSWSWARKLVKDYSEISQIKIYNCKESHNSNGISKRVFVSSNLPKTNELKKLKQNSKQKIITSLDMDFLYLNNFERKDFEKIIKSLDYPRDYIDIYFFDSSNDELDKLQNDFILSLLEHLIKKQGHFEHLTEKNTLKTAAFSFHIP
ncbi:MAG: hypothetical protein QW484_01650 [Candidatus Pacearchaeota archaeon]